MYLPIVPQKCRSFIRFSSTDGHGPDMSIKATNTASYCSSVFAVCSLFAFASFFDLCLFCLSAYGMLFHLFHYELRGSRLSGHQANKCFLNDCCFSSTKVMETGHLGLPSVTSSNLDRFITASHVAKHAQSHPYAAD